MQRILDIITVTKDDLEGVTATIFSTRKLRACHGVRQIIIDGSGDHIQKKLQALVLGEDNIDYFYLEPHGIANAFNKGVSTANAEWVWFLNGRDEIHPKLDPHVFLHVLKASKGEMLICELEYMQSGSRYSHPPIWALWPPVMFWIPHPASLIRRELFDKYGYFREEFKMAMDGEIWFRFFSKGITVDMLSLPITLFDEGGVSRTHRAEVSKEGLKIIRSYMTVMLKMWVFTIISIFTAVRLFYKDSRSR